MGGQIALAAAVRWVAARAPDLAPLHLRRCSSGPVPGNLNEAHATEVGLVRVLQSQIAMSPRGRYRTGLEKHLRETEAHAERVQARLRDLSQPRADPLLAGIERANEKRSTVLTRITALQGDEPWPGYDDLNGRRGPRRGGRRRGARECRAHLRAGAQEPCRRRSAVERELSNA